LRRLADRKLIMAVGALVMVTACGRFNGGGASGRLAGTEITFSISVSPEEKPAIQTLLSRFETQTKARVNVELLGRFRSQVGARVNLVTSINSSQLVERLRADARQGKTSIQLFAQDNLGLNALVDERLVQDLSEVTVPDSVSPSLVPPSFGGKQYFLPFRPNVRLAYANRERLDDAGVTAPTTVEELKVTAEKLKALTGRPEVTLSLAEGDPAAVTISEWIVSFGGEPLLLNDKGSKEALQFLQDLWKEGLVARESLFAKFDTEVDNLSTGAAWLAQNWPITSAGKQREAALGLARFLMSKQAQEYLVSHNAWPSIRDDAYDNVPKQQQATFGAIREALKDGWFRPSVPYWPEVTKAISEAVDRILLQSEPVDVVLDDLHARVAAEARAKGSTYPP